jgi:hypothetical protein
MRRVNQDACNSYYTGTSHFVSSHAGSTSFWKVNAEVPPYDDHGVVTSWTKEYCIRTVRNGRSRPLNKWNAKQEQCFPSLHREPPAHKRACSVRHVPAWMQSSMGKILLTSFAKSVGFRRSSCNSSSVHRLCCLFGKSHMIGQGKSKPHRKEVWAKLHLEFAVFEHFVGHYLPPSPEQNMSRPKASTDAHTKNLAERCRVCLDWQQRSREFQDCFDENSKAEYLETSACGVAQAAKKLGGKKILTHKRTILPIKTARAQSISGVVMIMVRRRRGTLKRAHKWSMQRAQARNPTNRDRQRRIDKDDIFFGGKVARS